MKKFEILKRTNIESTLKVCKDVDVLLNYINKAKT